MTLAARGAQRGEWRKTTWFLVAAAVLGVPAQRHTPLEIVGPYWHFVRSATMTRLVGVAGLV